MWSNEYVAWVEIVKRTWVENDSCPTSGNTTRTGNTNKYFTFFCTGGSGVNALCPRTNRWAFAIYCERWLNVEERTMLYCARSKNVGELFWLHTELIEFRSKHHEHMLNFFELTLGNKAAAHFTHCFANFAHNFDAVGLVALASTKEHS